MEATNGLNGYILGDAGYACKSYLLTPVSNPRTSAEKNYNKSFILTRITVERLFGIWKKRFPILSTQMRVNVHLSLIIIVATAVLHNIAIDKNDDNVFDEINNISNMGDEGIELPTNERGEANFAVRTALINQFFTN